MSDTPGQLRGALRRGRPDQISAALLGLPLAERVRLRSAIHEAARAIDDAAYGDRDPAGRWVGPLRGGHDRAATTALLATATSAQAIARYPVDATARDLIPLLFPNELEAFVEAWSQRFLANPRAWDQINGIEAMFDWAQRGLVPPPTHQGAVLLLIRQSHLWGYLREHPVLIDTTLPLLFRVQGIKGASVAQREQFALGGSLGGYVIPRLVREGLWSREDVLAQCNHARSVPRSDDELRWFRDLETRIAALHPTHA